MRLWHEALIPYLPRQQLLGQHRECCALRGGGWGKKHATVDYVFRHPYGWLVRYHGLVMEEMLRRGYQPDPMWWGCCWRGKKCPHFEGREWRDAMRGWSEAEGRRDAGRCIYPEHDEAYLQECLANLAGKGIHIEMEVRKC